jgi:hypothetical protein
MSMPMSQGEQGKGNVHDKTMVLTDRMHARMGIVHTAFSPLVIYTQNKPCSTGSRQL